MRVHAHRVGVVQRELAVGRGPQQTAVDVAHDRRPLLVGDLLEVLADLEAQHLGEGVGIQVGLHVALGHCSQRRFRAGCQLRRSRIGTSSPQIPQRVTHAHGTRDSMRWTAPQSKTRAQGRENVHRCIAIRQTPTIRRVAPLPERGSWAAPLPDLSRPAINHRIRIGAARVSHRHLRRPARRRARARHRTWCRSASSTATRPLAPHDLGLRSADACANVWAYLTNRLNETVVQFYTPRPRPTGELNPRLGCWGPRPDLIEEGLAESDCAIAVVLGLSIWVPGASPPVDDTAVPRSAARHAGRSLSYWVVVPRRQPPDPQDRRN